MKMKLLALNYQRNGVMGDGFFTALVQNISDTKGKFLITFTTDESCNDAIEKASCRVVMLEGNENSFYECWRGDSISYDLQNLLTTQREKTNVASLYDLQLWYKNKATGENFNPVRYKEIPMPESVYVSDPCGELIDLTEKTQRHG